MTYQGIIFDFDYTLGDSSKGIIESVNYAFNLLGLPLPNESAIKATIGLSLIDAFEQLTGLQNKSTASEFERLFIERADEIMVDATFVYQESLEILERLKAQNISTGIVSTKHRYRIEKVLDNYQARQLLDFIVGGEDVTKHKPAPEGLQKAISHLQLNAGNTLYVGDSLTDAKTAKNISIPFAAVLTGVTKKEAFEPFPNVAILQNVIGLLDLI